MDFYKNLPAPARIGIPAVLAIIVALIVYLTVLKKETYVTVLETQNYNVFKTSQSVLDKAGIEFKKESDATKSSYKITVLPPVKTDASNALGASGIKDLSGNIKEIACPAPPGFTATKKANERADNCEDAKSVQNMLITAGASAANVKVSQMANETLLGPESSKSVMAQVFLDSSLTRNRWAADQAARAIATAIGTSIDNVTITDENLQTLFDGSQSGGSTSPMDGSTSTAGGGCSDMATATEIATKEAAVRSCYKQTIGDELRRLLGGSDRFVLTVGARIDARSRTSQFTRTGKGAVNSKLTDTGGGRALNDVNMAPSETTGGEVKPAGDIAKLSLSVVLDKNFVNADQELAVKRLLSTYVDPSRKDPAPRVSRYAFANGAGQQSDNAETLEALRDQTVAGGQDTDTRAPVAAEPKQPIALYALMGVVVAALLVALAVMWRRSTMAAAERARYEDEFRNSQRVLDTYAQQDPAAIARDLERMMGAPAPQGRAY